MDSFERGMFGIILVWLVITMAIWGTIGYVIYRILTHNNLI